MPKPRTKRADIREGRKRKRQGETEENYEKKRQRQVEETFFDNGNGDQSNEQQDGPAEKEFFGMLADEEQEYFRRADEMLELNQFPSSEERDVFIQSVFQEAKGKELKLASSQSCSRLTERLIQLSNTAQKKHLFEAFAGHFLSLVQHRFASHCCEALFLRSAGIVTQELAGFVLDTKGAGAEDQQPEASMESLFLATLDELEGGLGYLITDRFASHTLRVLLMVLSGRPLEDASARTLMKSKKKENISVVGSAAADEQNQGKRAVPASFMMAASKIIKDSTSGMDATGLRVLAKHPIGNPTLQLLLELDLTLSKGEKKADKSESEQPSLLYQLLPGAPQSLADESSEASEFINGMIYDQIGSRLIETLITHAPGKIFKTLNQNTFLPRIQGYVRNDISCYPAIKVLNRLSKDDLVSAVDKIAPTVPQLVAKSRYNVLKTLFERCAARGVNDEIKKLIKGLKEGCGKQPVDLVLTLCSLSVDEEEEKKKKKDVNQLTRNEYAIQSHGAQLLTTLLSISGPSKAVHEALSALPSKLLLKLATTSMPTVTLLTTAISIPSSNSTFQKSIVNTLTPHLDELATSQFGHNLVNAMVEIPSKGKDYSIPPHKKDAIMSGLAAHEAKLRDSWMGRSVWRTWKGDVWKTRRGDWKAWMREIDEQRAQAAIVTGANGHQKKERNEKKGRPERKEKQEKNDEAEKQEVTEETEKPEEITETPQEVEEEEETPKIDGEKEKKDKKDKKKKKKSRSKEKETGEDKMDIDE
ncbi:Nucleolar protein 9 [Cladobotryum mycophilum]|uniref:Nucleolar protein 9 n=1 Tax=Cladobotryum mycophilum TaxID=491253 RepID=A0ABR0SUB1_9HYPO